MCSFLWMGFKGDGSCGDSGKLNNKHDGNTADADMAALAVALSSPRLSPRFDDAPWRKGTLSNAAPTPLHYTGYEANKILIVSSHHLPALISASTRHPRCEHPHATQPRQVKVVLATEYRVVDGKACQT